MPKKDFFIKESDLDEVQHRLLYQTNDNSMVISGCTAVNLY